MQILVIDEPALNIGKLVEHLKKFCDHSDLSELVPSPNIPMQADAQICQNIVEDQLGYLFRIGLDFNEGEEDSVRDNLYRIVAGKLLHG